MHHHSPTGSVEDGGWTLAARTKRGCRRSHIFSAAMTSKCQANLDGSSKNAFAEDGPMGENDERGIQAEVEQLTVRMERYKQKMPHKYLNTILCFIKRILRNCPLELIRTFGIGPIGTSKSSVYQLVLLEAIKDHFGVPTVTCQDPVTSLCEKRYLQGRGITVLPADDLLTPPPVDVRSTGFTLLYMFHCSPEMYNNVLSWYLLTHRLQNVILIGNEPNDCLSSSKTFPIANASIPLTNLSIFAFQSVAFRLPKFEPLEFAFESSFISYLDINTDTDEQNNEDFLRKIIV